MSRPCATCRHSSQIHITVRGRIVEFTRICCHPEAAGKNCRDARREDEVCGPEARLFEEENLH